MNVLPYLKAVFGTFTPAILTLIWALLPVSDGGKAWLVTGAEWSLILGAAGVTGAAVFTVPNKDPKAKHQAESVQPPHKTRRA